MGTEPWTEYTALGLLMTTVRGRKVKQVSPVQIGEAAKFLLTLRGSSVAALAKEVNASRSQILDFLRISRLSPGAKKVVEKGFKTLITSGERRGYIGIDVAARLATIRDPSRQEEVTRAVRGLKSHDARQVIDFARLHPRISAEKCAKEVLAAKSESKTVQVFIVGIPLTEEQYSALRRLAQEGNMSSEAMAKKLLLDKLGGH